MVVTSALCTDRAFFKVLDTVIKTSHLATVFLAASSVELFNIQNDDEELAVVAWSAILGLFK